MSETSINQATSEDLIHVPLWRTLLHLVIAVLSPALAPFPVWLLMIPLWLGFGALSYYSPPGILQDLAEAALITATTVLFLGGSAAFGVGISFVIFGIPAAILGWRFGWITWRSSILAGFLIGCLPLLILPFDQSFDPNYLSTTQVIHRVVGGTLVMGVLGAFEGFLFWLVWRRSVPT